MVHHISMTDCVYFSVVRKVTPCRPVFCFGFLLLLLFICFWFLDFGSHLVIYFLLTLHLGITSCRAQGPWRIPEIKSGSWHARQMPFPLCYLSSLSHPPFFFFFPCLRVIVRVFFWLCTQKSLLVVSHGMSRIKPRSSACKASALPATLSLQPKYPMFSCCTSSGDFCVISNMDYQSQGKWFLWLQNI